MANTKSIALSEAMYFPPFKERGITVDIQSTGTIALRSGAEITNEHMHRLSLEDSMAVMNIIRMSIKEEGL